MKEFCNWLERLIGSTVRGRAVLDSEATLQGDGSARVVLTVSAGQTPADRLLTDPDELVWHMDDVTTYETADPVWEYWDEFAERTA